MTTGTPSWLIRPVASVLARRGPQRAGRRRDQLRDRRLGVPDHQLLYDLRHPRADGSAACPSASAVFRLAGRSAPSTQGADDCDAASLTVITMALLAVTSYAVSVAGAATVMVLLSTIQTVRWPALASTVTMITRNSTWRGSAVWKKRCKPHRSSPPQSWAARSFTFVTVNAPLVLSMPRAWAW